MNDPYQLQRFVDAQQPIFEQALAELQAGRKRTHWMWFVFPQLQGLGHSATARHYGISGADEARAYLEHPLLGPRLERCTQALLQGHERSATRIFGSPDDLKLRSCMSLFAAVSAPGSSFQQVLDAFYDGQPDPATLAKLG
ncbi:DUF1810 domain-containing protein [Pseudomonas borbori]